jgi:hypothetical protein
MQTDRQTDNKKQAAMLNDRQIDRQQKTGSNADRQREKTELHTYTQIDGNTGRQADTQT